jgi:flagella basal body P-ring formation protein FlgA
VRTRALLAALALLLPSALAAQPVPRDRAVVEGGSVLVGDIFDNAGAAATRVLGPGPAPGQRFVVEAPQLAVIAREAGLSWTPLAGDERVVVERPGRLLREEEVVEVLRAGLTSLGADPDLDIEIPGYQPMMVPPGADPRLLLEATQYDADSHRFSTTLTVLAEGMATLRQRLNGRVVAMREVVVAARALRSGEVLTPRDLRAARLPAERLRPGAAERLQQVVGRRLERPIGIGLPVRLADLGEVQTVTKDAAVILVHEVPGLALTARGKALESGAMGTAIPVQNLVTGTVVMAEVLAPDRVRAIGPLPPSRPTSGRPNTGGLAQR